MTGPTIGEHVCTVIRNVPLNDEYRELVLRAPAAALRAHAGQFFNLLCPPTDGVTPFFRRPLSLYRLERAQGRLHFLSKVVGVGTRALARLHEGDALNIVGPLGRGFWLEPGWETLLLLARGVGLATLAALAQTARAQDRSVIVICSARSPQHLLPLDYLRMVGATVHTVTDNDGSAAMPAVEALLRTLIEKQGVDALFTCGSNRLLRLLQTLGRAYHLPGQAALEQQMACGLGVCHGCVRPFVRAGERVDLRVCKDGPVFDLQEVA